MQVPLYRHNLHGHDIEALGEEFKKVLRGMMLSTGNVSADVAARFAGYMGIKHCLLTNSWTSAAQATLLALGIGQGDEVIIPSLTFVATANAIESVGAKPVLVDVDPETKLMDIEQARSAVTIRTRAIMPVHLYGQMVDMVALRSAIYDSIPIIEDAAHAIEGRRDGYAPGQRSDAAMFSFYNSKNLTTGEGGAMVTNNDGLLDRFTTIYRHGIDLDGFKRHVSDDLLIPEAVSRGLKGNMPDLLAFLLAPQIDDIPNSHAKRMANAEKYLTALDGIGLEFPQTREGVVHAWHIFAAGIDAGKRSSLLRELDKRGIRTTVQFKPVHCMRYYSEKYGYQPNDYPHSRAWGEKVFSLPVFSDMRPQEQDYVIDNIRSIISSLP